MDFRTFLQTLGIIPPQVIEPGRWIRCATEDHPKSRNGALKLFADGLAGVAQNHATMHDVAIWRHHSATMPAVAPEALRAQMDRARTERLAGELRATSEAWSAWCAAKPIRNSHPYLEKKKLDLTGAHNLRVDKRGSLLVPMYDRIGNFMSLQSIDGDGGKKFWLGAPASGARHLLSRSCETVRILCEGLSTGLTLFAAVPNAAVIIAFNAGNMERVAQTKNWRGLCVVAGDNDVDTEERIGRNPGAQAALAASRAIGCGAGLPAGPGDWNDVYCARLAELEEQSKLLAFVPSAQSLRARALIPVQAGVMRNAVYVAPK